MRSQIRAVWLLGWFVVACGDDGPAGAPPAPKADAGFDAPELCPDPQHPRVHYASDDTFVCQETELQCTADQNGFDNACGCGCIDKGDPLCPVVVNPDITWWSRDPAECPDAGLPACPLNAIPFSNSCGCGCKLPGS